MMSFSLASQPPDPSQRDQASTGVSTKLGAGQVPEDKFPKASPIKGIYEHSSIHIHRTKIRLEERLEMKTKL